MSRLCLRAVLLGTLLSVCALLANNSADAQDPNSGFQAAWDKYQADMKRPALYIRTRTMIRLAETRDPRALQALVARYARPEAPEDHVRYLVAAITALYFNDSASVETWEKWLDKNDSDPDAWLWYWGQQVRAKNGQLDDVLDNARKHKNDYMRAASIEALGALKHIKVPALVVELLADEKMKDMEFSLIAEACASALYEMRESLGNDDYNKAVNALIDLYEREKLPERTKLVIGRHLKGIFDVDFVAVDAGTWRQIMQSAGAVRQNDDPDATAPVFMGIKGTGERICYVIDLSDSMMTPLNSREREELEHAETEEGNKGENQPGKLPWNKINNRFEAAREFLKLAISELAEEKLFAVIIFGDEAEPLMTTPKMIKATDSNKNKVTRELDSIRPGPATPERRNGTLKGMTNLHGGICRAFQMTTKGVMSQFEHVDENGFESGADAIFVLSDGAPVWDDYNAIDDRDPEDQGGDPEGGTMGQNTPQLHYCGPYTYPWQMNPGWPFHLLDDIKRMTLYRNVEINCVGIGEADASLLEAITQIGMGKLKRVGAGDDPGGFGGRRGR